MDAIDDVRMRLAALEARISVIEAENPSAALSAIDLDNILTKLSEKVATLTEKVDELSSSVAMTGANHYFLQDSIVRLTNQVAIVSATLGSAIYALKKGDTAASDQALADALEMQDRLGTMIDSLSGRPG